MYDKTHYNIVISLQLIKKKKNKKLSAHIVSLAHSHTHSFMCCRQLSSCYKSSVAVTETISSAKPEIVYLVLQRKFADSNKRKNTTALVTHSHQKCLTWI